MGEIVNQIKQIQEQDCLRLKQEATRPRRLFLFPHVSPPPHPPIPTHPRHPTHPQTHTTHPLTHTRPLISPTLPLL